MAEDLPGEKLFYDLRHAFNLPVCHLWIDGKAEALARGFLGDGEITWLIPQVRVGFLEVEGQGIMQGAADLVRLEMLLQRVALRVTDDVQMPGTLGVAGLTREL